MGDCMKAYHAWGTVQAKSGTWIQFNVFPLGNWCSRFFKLLIPKRQIKHSARLQIGDVVDIVEVQAKGPVQLRIRRASPQPDKFDTLLKSITLVAAGITKYADALDKTSHALEGTTDALDKMNRTLEGTTAAD